MSLVSFYSGFACSWLSVANKVKPKVIINMGSKRIPDIIDCILKKDYQI